MRTGALVAMPVLLLVITSGARAAPLVNTAVHPVRPGETLWAISRQHGVAVEVLAAANRLTSLDRLQIGDRLTIPPAAAAEVRPLPSASARHVVRSGDTVWSIAKMHGMAPEALARLNRLADESRIQVGQVLRTGRPAAPSSPPGLFWPSRGVITSRFGFRGRRHHHGIDIAAPVGTLITAARDGIVTFAGWKGGYGALVILDHGGGLTTWYGHASRLLVAVGERVVRGQLIARVGTTGSVTGPNLHFEVRRNNTPLNPLPYLQGTR